MATTHRTLLQNYFDDLIRSKTRGVLVELSHQDLDKMCSTVTHSNKFDLPILIAKKVYDGETSESSTNIIPISCEQNINKPRFFLFEQLLQQLNDEIKHIKNFSVIKESLKGAASIATAGLLGDIFSKQLDDGFGFLLSELSDYLGGDLINTAYEPFDISKYLFDSTESALADIFGGRASDTIDGLKKQKITLSSTEKERLSNLSKTFSSAKTIDLFQVAIKLILAISIDSPKLIYIRNPHYLDKNSIAIISLLLALTKDSAQKSIGISVVYEFCDETFNYYSEVPDPLLPIQKQLLNQRRFLQRYSLLETPNTIMPNMAVKGDVFVGRQHELTLLAEAKANHKKRTFSVIAGEPGVGKTTLAKIHLENVHNVRNIFLSIVNELGHSSTNIGISALEKSIDSEFERIKLINGWKEKGIQYLKDINVKTVATAVAGKVLSGSDKVINIAEAAIERYKVQDRLNELKLSSKENLDLCASDEKEHQFHKIHKKLQRLESLTEKNSTIYLLIDDLQWIDKTLAEYLVKFLFSHENLYVVVTIRPSDAKTMAQEHFKNFSLNRYILKLFEYCRIELTDTSTHSPVDLFEKTQYILLDGFSLKDTQSLIQQVIQGNKDDLVALSDTTFSYLTKDNENRVNTLFVIETVNMLCDPNLYTENNLPQLIVGKPTRLHSNIQSVPFAVSQALDKIQSKYQDSLRHLNDSSDNFTFNLMAYAVMEERLALLEVYLDDYGPTAVYSLLISSLLGVPFSSALVRDVIYEIASAESESSQVQLSTFFREPPKPTGLLISHFDALENSFDILRKLNADANIFQFRHSILHTFYDKQFDYQVQKWVEKYGGNEADSLSGNLKYQLLIFIDKVIRKKSKSDGFSFIGRLQTDHFTSKELFKFRLYSRAQLNVAVKLTTIKNTVGLSGRVFNFFGYIGESLNCTFRPIDRIMNRDKRHESISKAVCYTCKPYLEFSQNSEFLISRLNLCLSTESNTFIKELVEALNNEFQSATFYVNNGDIDRAIKILEETSLRIEVLDLCKLEDLNGLHVFILNCLSYLYSLQSGVLMLEHDWSLSHTAQYKNPFREKFLFDSKVDNIDSEAISKANKNNNIIRTSFQSKLCTQPEKWALHYEVLIESQAFCSWNNNDLEEAKAIFNDVVEHFRRNPILFLESLDIIFDRLVLLYKQNQSIPGVIDTYENILDILLPYLKEPHIEFKKKYIEISYDYSEDLRKIHRDANAQQKRADLVERVYRAVNLYF